MPGDPVAWIQIGRYLDAVDYELLWGVPQGFPRVDDYEDDDSES